MRARIYQRPKNAMQSGRARTHDWVIDFEPASPRTADPLTGWTGSNDTQTQLRLSFPTQQAAEAYARQQGWDVDIVPTPTRRLKIQAYADNFR